MGTTAGNAAVTLACWDSSTGASKQGSSALVAYATEKGISTTGDNKQIQFTEIEDGNYVLTFTRDVVMSNGDRFCIHDTDTNGSDTWVHFHDSTFPAYNRQWFTDGTEDMEVRSTDGSSTVTVRQIRLKIDNSDSGNVKYSLEVRSQRAASMSSYGLQVWDTASRAWDTSGGLNDVFADSDPFPLPEKFKRYESDNRKFLAFYGPLDADDIAALEAKGATAKKWASADYREGTKFAREEATELYVIDFTEAEGHPEGIHITVPLQAQPEDGGYDASSTGVDGVPMFYRNGIRFGFFDFDFNENVDRPTDHLRFVKWGHVFRLNEISRPLNAFPQFDSNNNFTTFTDDFGPCVWNGVKMDSDDFQNKPANDYNTRSNKLGDTRLLAEYPMYLKRIWLEVAYCKENPAYKRLYLSFEGDYDMPALVQFEQKYIYNAATNGSCVTSTPNIFRGADAKMGEPAFRRFYNLRTKDESGNDTDEFVKARLGCSLKEYLSHTGIYHILYDLDFRDPYEVVSSRSLLNAAGKHIPYADAEGGESAPGVSSTVEIVAKGGYYYNVDGTEETKLDYSPAGLDTFVDAKKVGLLFDPEDVDHTPAKIHLTGEYNFPNQTKPTKVDRVFDIEFSFPELSYTLSPSASAIEMSTDKTCFWSRVSWNAANNKISNSGTLPVYTYAVSHYADNTSEAADDAVYSYISEGNTTLDGTNRDRWLDQDDSTCGLTHFHNAGTTPDFDYYNHYNVEAVYNFAYGSKGLWRESRLIDNGDGRYDAEAFSKTEGTVRSRAAADLTTPVDVTTAKGFKYVIRPLVAPGKATATFTNDTQTTGIETVGADSNAPAEYFDLLGRRVATPQPGQLVIRRQGNTATKVVFE